MKHWIQQHRQSAFWVGLTLVIPVYLVMNVVTGILSVRADIRDQIESIEPRIARLQGLIDHESDMQGALGAVSAGVRDSVYPATADAATVAANLQAEVRQIFADAGMDISNSQVLPVRAKERFDYVAVKIVAKGSLEQLQQGLAEMALFRPAVWIEHFDATPGRSRRNAPDEQELTVSLQLLTLRVAS